MGDHARSFAWLMLIVGTFLATLTVVQDILVHFVFGNPTKIQQQASMLAILLTFDFLIATLGLHNLSWLLQPLSLPEAMAGIPKRSRF